MRKHPVHDHLFLELLVQQGGKSLFLRLRFPFFKWQFEKHLHFQLSTFNFQFFPHPGNMDAGGSLTTRLDLFTLVQIPAAACQNS
jgi:hypothetical protein